MYLKPLSFKEYLTAFGHHALREYLEQATLTTPIADPVHERLLKLVREYVVLGGMPAVLQTHLKHHDMQRNQLMQTTLLNTYRNDFGKYATQANHKYLRRVFEKVPGLIAEHFKYSKVDPDLQTRDIKKALEMLHYAGLIHSVYSTAATNIPLISLINEKKFKLLFLDIGLVMRTSKLAHEILLQEDILLINRGALAEQFAGQELLAYTSCFEEAELYFWCREQKSSQAEVDFVTTVDSHIIPIEVKAGATGRLKSLRIFMEEKKSKIGVRISQNKLSLFDNILSVPLYLISEIPRLICEVPCYGQAI